MIKKQLLYSLIFSYVAVVIVGICLYTSLNIIAINNIEEEITRNYDSMLNNLASNMDYILDDVKNISLDVKGKTNIRGLLFLGKEINYQDNYKYIKAVEDLASIRSYNSFIKDIYVYYNTQEVIINSSGLYYPDVAYATFHNVNKNFYDQWIEIINSECYEGKIIRLDNQLFYMQTLFTYSKQSYANIVIMFDQQRLKTVMGESSLAEYGYVGLLDNKDNILLYNTSNKEVSKIKNIESIYDNKKYTVLSMYSTKNPYKYIGIIPNKIFKQKTSYINKVFLLFTCIFLAILFVGIYFIYKKYGHVRILLNKIKSAVKINDENRYGELEYIEKAVFNMHNELESDKCLIVENVLRKAIYRTEQSQEDIEKYLGEKFSNSCFLLGSLVLDDEVNNGKEQIDKGSIKNIFKEYLNCTHCLNVLEYYNGYILIINFEPGDLIYEDAINKLNLARNYIEENFELTFVLSLSDIHTGVNSLSTAYEEVEKALEYRMFFSMDKLVAYNQIIKEETPYIYSIEDQISLTKYIKEGCLDKALDVLEKIFDQNFKQRNLSLGKTKKLIYGIGVTLENIGHNFGLDKADLINRINSRKNIKSIYNECEDIINTLCNKVQNTKEKKVDDKVQCIIEYIEKHYHEEDLTVTTISDVFGMKVSYISRFFKENTGENLLQYITKYRITKAKKLLVETNKNLNEIAEEIGLLNNVALIRSFKKYEYITPSEYRSANTGLKM